MIVETPYRDFLAFWARAQDAPRGEQERLWHELYAGRHADLIAYYFGLFGESARLDAALPRFGEVAGALDSRFASLRLDTCAQEVAALLDAPALERAVALVGLFTADAWVDEMGGSPCAYFALEMIGAGDPLVTHELAHASHRLARGEDWGWSPLLMLLNEGVATTTTLRLRPGLPLEQHFNVDDYAAWEAAADADWPRIVEGLLACPQAEDLPTLRRFFWPDWGRPERDVPERVGYLAGARVIDVLLGGHDLTQIVRWPAERAAPEVRAALEAIR